ncbi:MAG: hypothetical protein MJZ85_10715 [Bacteroidales bacterium]|nr:hypothetical protein [Bacteroidales bacterium]
MKKLLLSAVAAVMALFMMSCGGPKVNELSIKDFSAKAKDFVGQEVSIKGVANHICSHSGRKLFLVSPDGGDAMVTVFTNPEMTPFDRETIGKTYTVNGVVKITQTIDAAYLDAWEAEVLKAIEEGQMPEEEHCGTEAKAAGLEVDEQAENQELAQIKQLRARIEANNGEPIHFYHVECNDFNIE